MMTTILPIPKFSSYASRMTHDPLLRAKRTAASGMDAQTTRLQVISENLANVHTTAPDRDSDPYRRRMAVFAHDNATGQVLVKKIIQDLSDFRREHSPLDPAADEKGFIKLTNVNPLTEMVDLRQADQSFSACLKAYEASIDLDKKIVDLLRA
ncbi:MAG: flagellar basal body rod protein FlgC [Holosporales bacterium]|jgi:flagellar basal-body rod protein FlgC|nr:flagellar basal body rod protein FlgC [Holosporales bacterium]